MKLNDSIAAAALMQKYAPDAKTMTRLRNDYNLFKSLNPQITGHANIMQAIFGQMKTSGLEPGSIVNYLRTMDTIVPSSWRAYAVIAAAEAHASDRGGRGHAPDIKENELLRYVREAIAEDTEDSGHVWILYATGLRPVDVSRLWNDSVFLEQKMLTVLARWTKGIRKIKNRRQISYPIDGLLAPPPTLRKKLLELRRQSHSKKDIRRVWGKCTHKSVNDYLVHLRNKHKLPTITSGTFRRSFSSRINAYCKRTSIPKSEMMLHVCPTMDQAHYSFDTKH